MKYKFLYQDQHVSPSIVESYKVGDFIYEYKPVVASWLRGGLLTNTNLRYLFITNIGGNFRIEDEDYLKQGLYIFQADLYYNIYDNYQVGQYVQVLLSPQLHLTDIIIEDVVKQARADFNQLLHKRPVPALDTQSWRSRFSSPLGTEGKSAIHQSAI